MSPHPNAGARLVIQRDQPSENVSDLADLIGALDGLIVPCAWLSIVAQEGLEADERARLYQALGSRRGSEKARARFYPSFGVQLGASIPPITLASWDDELGSEDVLDPLDALDIGLQYGLNTWFRQTVRQLDDQTYNRVFGFASVERIEHRSPIVIETAIVVGGIAGTALVRLARSIYKLRTERAATLSAELKARVDRASEPDRIEAEHQKARQEAARTRQEEAKAEVLEAVVSSIRERGAIVSSDHVARAVTEAASPAVAELIESEFTRFEITGADGPTDAAPPVNG
jgi:hypothetical protein